MKAWVLEHTVSDTLKIYFTPSGGASLRLKFAEKYQTREGAEKALADDKTLGYFYVPVEYEFEFESTPIAEITNG